MLTSEQYVRLVEQLQEQGDCLIWTGSVHVRGYGQYLHQRVHKVYWEHNNGEVPDGYELAHSCGVKLCVRHVRPKTHLENMQEDPGKTRQEMCKRGLHLMTEENTYIQPSRPSNRKCRECRKIDQREAYATRRSRT